MESGTTLLGVSVLGPTEAVLESGPASVPGHKGEALLALLALALPRAVSDDRLIDELWGDDQPANPANSLQAQVSQLRRLLGRGAVTWAAAGYRLALGPDDVDAIRLERLVGDGRAAAAASDHQAALANFVAAVALLRGPPLMDLLDHAFARDASSRLDEVVMAAHEGMVDGQLASGRHADVVIALNELVAAHPLRERFHAQLVLALFRCGRQTEALRACRRARAVLAEEVGLEPGPELRALERAVLAHDPALAAPVPLASIDRQPALPASLTTFIGRAAEVAELQERLVSSRLVTVVGAAGVGKTRLALAVAATLAADREVRLVELGPIGDQATVPEAVASALGAADRSPTSPSAAERAARAVGGRAVVLVLDNCEHVLEAVAALVTGLLRACPELRVIATSRQPLGADGEQQLALGPLRDDDAVALFVDRARAVQPSFDAADEGVSGLCRRLDGLPLAIELAAARCKSLPVPEIELRLANRFELLVGGPEPDRPDSMGCATPSTGATTSCSSTSDRRSAGSPCVAVGSPSAPSRPCAARPASRPCNGWSTSRWSSPRPVGRRPGSRCWSRCASTAWIGWMRPASRWTLATPTSAGAPRWPTTWRWASGASISCRGWTSSTPSTTTWLPPSPTARPRINRRASA